MASISVEDQKQTVANIFKKEPESKDLERKTTPKEKKMKPQTRPVVDVEQKPAFLTTKQAKNGILHSVIGPEMFERAALFAYDIQAPVKDMTDLTRKALTEYLDREEPKLERLKDFLKKNK